MSPESRCNLKRVPAGYDWASSACDSSNSRRASAEGEFDSDSVSSVVPYSQLLRDDRVSFCTNWSLA